MSPRSRAETPPRKVVVGTTIFGSGRPYPGLAERATQLCGLVDEMALQATATPRGVLDLAILPEAVLTPNAVEASERSVPLDDPVFETFRALARRHRTYLVVPLDLEEPGRSGPVYSNAAVLLDRAGEVSGIYRKAHPVALVGEDDLEGGVTPGDAYPVFDCDFGRVGIQICWDVVFADGWAALSDAGAEIVALPSASPATVLPASLAARHRYFVVSSTPRNNATVYEPTGMVAARLEQPGGVLVHELDLSHAVVGWSSFLRDGAALRDRFGARVGYHYDAREDLGLFWSNDPATPVAEMLRSIGGEEIDDQIARNQRRYESVARKASGACVSRDHED